MDQYILHFFTGTMAFRSPQPPVYGSGAESSDAFLGKKRGLEESKRRKSCKRCRICKKYAGRLSILEQTGNHRLNRAEKNTQGRNGLGNGQEGQVIRQGAT